MRRTACHMCSRLALPSANSSVKDSSDVTSSVILRLQTRSGLPILMFPFRTRRNTSVQGYSSRRTPSKVVFQINAVEASLQEGRCRSPVLRLRLLQPDRLWRLSGDSVSYTVIVAAYVYYLIFKIGEDLPLITADSA
jgi:hypothetical protein